MGIVPSCTRAELPWVAEGVQGQLEGLIRVTSPGKWSTKSCAGVHRGVQRCAEGCVKVHRGVWRCMEVHGGVWCRC